MPLPMKTLRQASVEIGIPEAELRVMVDMRKIRSVLKNGVLMFAPDEIARIKRLRKTLQDSAKPNLPAPAAPKKPGPPKAAAPRPAQSTAARPAPPAARPAPPRVPPPRPVRPPPKPET